MEGYYHICEVEQKSTTMFENLRRLSNSVKMESVGIVKQIIMPDFTIMFRILHIVLYSAISYSIIYFTKRKKKIANIPGKLRRKINGNKEIITKKSRANLFNPLLHKTAFLRTQ